MTRFGVATLLGGSPDFLAECLHYSFTSIPIERAAPATIAIADSRLYVLRSGSLISAIFLICAFVTEPTFVRFGTPEPFSIPASFFSRTAAGGVLVMKEKDLSAKMVISTGRIVSWPCVRALNSLQKAMMLIPWGPSAVPTGGAGFALPAGICSLTKPTAFFAMILLRIF